MPDIRMNSLKSLAMNCGPLSEMTRGRAPGHFSFAPCKMISMAASVIDSRMSQFTTYRLKPSRMLLLHAFSPLLYWENAFSIFI